MHLPKNWAMLWRAQVQEVKMRSHLEWGEGAICFAAPLAYGTLR